MKFILNMNFRATSDKVEAYCNSMFISRGTKVHIQNEIYFAIRVGSFG